MAQPMFITRVGKFGPSYFSQDVSGKEWLVNLTALTRDAGGLYAHAMTVSTKTTNIFTSDLTENRDDVILAFLSLALMFIIEAIVTSMLLRTKDTKVGKFGFSIKLVIELARDFNLRHIWQIQKHGDNTRKHLNAKLVCFALLILTSTLGLEVGVLFLTSRELRDVNNSTANFRIQHGFLPGWDEVRFHTRASMNRPCVATGLVGVDGSQTKINGCVTSTLMDDGFQLFSKVEKAVNVIMTSTLHEYGAEHKITIGSSSAEYSVRVFFSLAGDNGDSRLMKEASISKDEPRQVEFVHKQYIAYLFSLYNLYLSAEGEEEVSLDTLNDDLQINPMITQNDEDVAIIKINGTLLKGKGRKYTSSMFGMIPQGAPALRMAQDMFRGLTGIVVTGPAEPEDDLFVRKGFDKKRAAVWREGGRVLNWLSMSIIICLALGILVATRVLLMPIGLPDMCAAWVGETIGAKTSARPVRFGGSRRSSFRVRATHREEGDHAAETRSISELTPRYRYSDA